MINIYHHSGRVVARTNTLRGVQDRSAAVGTRKLTLAPLPHGQALVHMMWRDQTHATVWFQNYGVAWQWAHQPLFNCAEYDEAPVIIDVEACTPT